MNGLTKELKRIRCLPAVYALIPINECMGIPFFAVTNILYVPFFEVDKNSFALSSELYIEYPACIVIKYKKVLNKSPMKTEEREMLLFKEKAQSSDFQYGIEDVPENMQDIYRNAREGLLNDNS